MGGPAAVGAGVSARSTWNRAASGTSRSPCSRRLMSALTAILPRQSRQAHGVVNPEYWRSATIDGNPWWGQRSRKTIRRTGPAGYPPVPYMRMLGSNEFYTFTVTLDIMHYSHLAGKSPGGHAREPPVGLTRATASPVGGVGSQVHCQRRIIVCPDRALSAGASVAWRARLPASASSSEDPSGWRARWGSRSFGAKNNDPLEVLVFPGLFERLSWLGWSVRDERQRWGRQPESWVKYHGKRGQYQRFSSIICVDEALRFPPHHGLRKYRWLFVVRLLRAPLHSRTASHLTQGRDIA